MKRMMKIDRVSLLVLLALTLFSCGKNQDIIETDPVIPKTEVVNNIFGNLKTNTITGLELGCFSISYPFSLIKTTGESILISNEAAFNAVNLANNKDIADFVYPVNIIRDGQQESIKTIRELAALFASCIPLSGYSADNFPAFLLNYDNSCYKIKYPINLKDPDGKKIVANSEAEFSDILAANDLIFFSWPILIEKQGDYQVEINSPAELLQSLISCDNIISPNDSINFDKIGCFDIVYPISFKTIGGIKSISSSEQLIVMLLKGEIIDFNYPIKLKSGQTGIVTIFNESDLNFLLNEYCGDCGCTGDIFYLIIGDPYFTMDAQCYKIQYPISITKENGNNKVFNSDSEIEQFVNSFPNDPGKLNYPLKIKMIGSGEIVTINKFDELLDILFFCP